MIVDFLFMEFRVIWLQEKKFRLQNKFDDLKDKGKRVMENFGEKRNDMLSKWEEKSRDFIDAFLLLFGRDGRLVRINFASTCILLVMFLSTIYYAYILYPMKKGNVILEEVQEF